MWRVLGSALLLIASCKSGSQSSSSSEKSPQPESKPTPPDAAPKARVWEKVKRPSVSAVCQAARPSLGYAATCVETPLPELETPAGKVIRLHDPEDPVRRRLYALVRPSGEVFVGDGGNYSTTLDEILKAIDLAATPPAKLAQIYETLAIESAVVRCLPGSNDVLPTEGLTVWKTMTCEPPKIVEEGGKRLLTFVEEEYPDPQLLNRDEHDLNFVRLEVQEHDLSSVDGAGLIRLDPKAPRPATLPPVPEMTTPPDWAAAPEKAPADLSAKLCAEAAARISGLEGQRCEAYGYPSLALPTGNIYYLANDAGQRYRWALQKPDGTIVASFDLDTTEHPLPPIVRNYDPAAVPAEKFVAVHLMLDGNPARILCLPGSGDTIPDSECTPPTAKKEGDQLVVKAILHELSIPRDKYTPSDPAIRAQTWKFGPNGGFDGDGFRLVDLREDE